MRANLVGSCGAAASQSQNLQHHVSLSWPHDDPVDHSHTFNLISSSSTSTSTFLLLGADQFRQSQTWTQESHCWGHREVRNNNSDKSNTKPDPSLDLCWTSRKPNLDSFEAWSTRKWIWSQLKEITGVDILGRDFWPRRQIRVILVQFLYFFNKYKTRESYSADKVVIRQLQSVSEL